jgi:hypothetical protein
MTNRRVYYATAGVTITGIGTTADTASHVARGLQTFSTDVNLNLESVFEIGQAAEYEQVEGLPEVNMTLNKVLDGNCPLYLLATNGSTTSDIGGRGDTQCIVRSYIYPDDHLSASGTPLQQLTMSGAYVESVGYNFPVEGPFNEDLTLSSTSRTWKSASFDFSGDMFDNTDTPEAVEGVNQRENLIFLPVATGTQLPPEVAGITSSGTNEETNGVFGASIQNLTVSVDFGREDILELGRFKEYAKLRAPVSEVTTEVEAIAKTGDLFDVSENGGNTTDRTIFIRTEEGLQIDLGTKNRIQSLSFGGFDAGGGNGTITYSFRNSNDFDIKHSGDITSALRP